MVLQLSACVAGGASRSADPLLGSSGIGASCRHHSRWIGHGILSRMKNIVFCPGTPDMRCRSGRGGGPARLSRGRHTCGTCGRRVATRQSPPSDAATAAQDACSRQSASADTAASYRDRKRNCGIEPSERTLAAVRTNRDVLLRQREHMAAPISGEGGMDRRGAALKSDWQRQQRWLQQMEHFVPEGMALNARWARSDEMLLTLEGMSESSSECCDAQIICHAADSGDETTPHYRTNHEFDCEDCGEQIESQEFARYIAPGAGGRPPRLVMPDMEKFAGHATRSRELFNAILSSNALIDANERLDEFLTRGGADDVITGDMNAGDLREGETGIRLMDELPRSAEPGKAIIQSWAVVDSHEGKRLHYSSPAETDRNAEFEQCLRPASDLAGRLP